MAKTHTVAVISLLLNNGQMANFGDEVGKEDIDGLDARVEQGYLLKKVDFDKQQKDADDKAKAALAAHNDLLAKYKEKFGVDAPATAKDEALSDAVKVGKAI